MREDEQVWLRQRNAELEVLVSELQHKLQEQTAPSFDVSELDQDAEHQLSALPNATLHPNHFAKQITALERTIEQLQTELHWHQHQDETLRASEERDRSIGDALPEGVFILNPNGIIETCNPSAQEILEVAVENLVSHSVLDLEWEAIHADGSPFDLADFPGLVTAKTGIPCSQVIIGICKPEKPITWISVNSQPLFKVDRALPSAVVVSFSEIAPPIDPQPQPLLSRKPAIPDRDQTQEAVREALQRLAFHMDNSPFAVIEWDCNLRITRWSREAEHLFGWSADEVLGRQFKSWEFVFPDDAKRVDRVVDELLSGQTASNCCHNRNYSKHGSIVHCEWYNSVLFNEGGKLVSVLSLVLNASSQKTAEAELRDSEERFRQLAENIQQIFWMYDLEQQKLIYISPACQQVIGYDSETCYSKAFDSWLKHVRPEDLPQVMKASRQALRGKPTEIIYQFRRTDGQQRWLLARAFPVRNEQGKVYRIAGIAEDISDRKEQEQRLRLLESVIVNANDAVVITEAEPVEPPGPRIVYVNDAFTRMMGYSRAEVIGKTPRILQGPKTDFKVLDKIRIALKDWKPAIAELVNYHKNGSEVWIELSIFPVADQTGHYTYWVGLQRDITQRKQAEVEMQKALEKERELSDLKSHFVTTASHEFRTPLSTILSSADMLEFYADNCSFEKQLEHIQRIQTAALNMKDLLSDVLVLERAEARKLQFEPAPLNLRLFCEELLDEMRLNDQNRHKLIFESQISDDEIEACMDGKLLRQILTNLLSNALKYSPANSSIWFRLGCDFPKPGTASHRAVAYFEVQDQGIGIPPCDRAHLFEAFHRGTNVGMISGNGLGLAIVKQSIELHRGTIKIQSQENRGTIARVTLPLQSDPQES